MHNMIILDYLFIAITAILVENIFFTRGLDSGDVTEFLAAPKGIIYYGGTFTVVSTICSPLAYAASVLFASSPYRAYILPLCYISIMAIIYVCGYYILKKCRLDIFEKVKSVIGYASVNCAMFGIMFVGVRQSANVFESIMYGFSAGIGFTLAMEVLVIARRRLVYSDVPKVFRGLPILMLYIGLLSLGIFGLLGHRLAA